MRDIGKTVSLCLLVCVLSWGTALAEPIRIKDLGKLQGWRENALFGYGIVTGLAGTGDSSSNKVTRQTMANVLSQFNLTIAPDQIQSRNVAMVMVSAALPAFAREGDTLDISVTSAGDARSLLGGSLLLTPLKAVNGKVYALAHGPLSVGGYSHDANGNIVQKNHPTAASIPNGAVIEVGLGSQLSHPIDKMTFVLSEPDFTTANRIAAAINSELKGDYAQIRDASGIDIAIPESNQTRPAAFVARLENVSVEPDLRAKVVINERTGTIVSGGDVRLSKVVVSHGDIKISISNQTSVSQPSHLWQPGNGVKTAIVTNTRIDVEETESSPGNTGFVEGGNTVSDLVQSLARLKTSTRDIISILRAVKAAGALHAELVVQ